MRFKTKIAIKLPVTRWKDHHIWGDYHMGLALKREFERRNFDVILQTVPEWYNGEDEDCEVVIVLRGLNNYKTQEHHFNIMWNISHPDMVKLEEYNQYDHVFIASEFWAEHIREKVDVPVTPLLQCTDPELFYPDYDSAFEHELLFVGQYRPTNRKIIEDLIPTDKDLAVYGTNWQYSTLDEKYFMDNHIPNNKLRKAYSSCKILLNDHHDDMRDKGFISNRLFDGMASGAFIISDEVRGGSDIFGDILITYQTPEELKSLVDTYLENDDARIKKALKGQKIVDKHHTYQNRVEDMLKVINSNISPKLSFENSNLEPEVYIERLWNIIILPVLNKFQSKDIMEIGSDQLIIVQNILGYCQTNNAHLTSFNSSLNKHLDNYSNIYGNNFEVKTGNLLNLQEFKNFDAIILNCNKNLNILGEVLQKFETELKDFPLIILYNINTPDNAMEQNTNYNGIFSNLRNITEKFINESDSQLSYKMTEAFQGLILIYPNNESNKDKIEPIFNDTNLLGFMEEERQKFTVAYYESKNITEFLETKLIETKTDLDIKEDELQSTIQSLEQIQSQLKTQIENYNKTQIQLKKQIENYNKTQIQLKTQIDTSNKLTKEKLTLTNKINETEEEYKKLKAQYDSLSNDLYKIKYQNGENRPLLQKLISTFPSLYILLRMNKKGLKKSLIYIKAYHSIKRNNLLDIGYYLRKYNDVRLSGQDPIIHYLNSGFCEGRQPNPDFDCAEYIERHKDVKISKLDPLVHYSLYGLNENRNPVKNK